MTVAAPTVAPDIKSSPTRSIPAISLIFPSPSTHHGITSSSRQRPRLRAGRARASTTDNLCLVSVEPSKKRTAAKTGRIQKKGVPLRILV